MILGALFANNLLHQLTNTVIVFIIIIVLSFLVYVIFHRKCVTKKSQARFRARLIYIACFILIIFVLQIWVQGVRHILTMMSLVAAGLVVSNKESIMNLVGGMIIRWRGVFTEGDFIQVQNYVGYVVSLHPFYFKLYETNQLDKNKATGHTIKVPNGIVVSQPVITFTPESNVALSQLEFKVEVDADCKKLMTLACQIIQKTLSDHYGDNKHYSQANLSRQNRKLSQLIDLMPTVCVEVKPGDIHMTIRVDYYCYPNDRDTIKSAFWIALFKKNKANNLRLAL